jgi:hypothetical protein
VGNTRAPWSAQSDAGRFQALTMPGAVRGAQLATVTLHAFLINRGWNFKFGEIDLHFLNPPDHKSNELPANCQATIFCKNFFHACEFILLTVPLPLVSN